MHHYNNLYFFVNLYFSILAFIATVRLEVFQLGILHFINFNLITAMVNQAIMSMVSLAEVLPAKAFRGLV